MTKTHLVPEIVILDLNHRSCSVINIRGKLDTLSCTLPIASGAALPWALCSPNHWWRESIWTLLIVGVMSLTLQGETCSFWQLMEEPSSDNWWRNFLAVIFDKLLCPKRNHPTRILPMVRPRPTVLVSYWAHISHHDMTYQSLGTTLPSKLIKFTQNISTSWISWVIS